MATETTALQSLDKARQMLAEARTVSEAKQIRDQAEALRVYAQEQKYSLECLNYCTEIKIRAERKAGGLLTGMRESGQRAGRGDKEMSGKTTLEELGITRDQSSQWQRVASIEDAVFEGWIAEIKNAGDRLSTAGLLEAVARQKENKDRRPREQTTEELLLRLAERIDAVKHRIVQMNGEWAPLLKQNPDEMGRITAAARELVAAIEKQTEDTIHPPQAPAIVRCSRWNKHTWYTRQGRPAAKLVPGVGWTSFDIASSMQKHVRRAPAPGSPEFASFVREGLFWITAYDLAGGKPFLSMMTFAAEDIGLGALDMPIRIHAMSERYRRLDPNSREARQLIIDAYPLLCAAPKSRMADWALNYYYRNVKMFKGWNAGPWIEEHGYGQPFDAEGQSIKRAIDDDLAGKSASVWTELLQPVEAIRTLPTDVISVLHKYRGTTHRRIFYSLAAIINHRAKTGTLNETLLAVEPPCRFEVDEFYNDRRPGWNGSGPKEMQPWVFDGIHTKRGSGSFVEFHDVGALLVNPAPIPDPYALRFREAAVACDKATGKKSAVQNAESAAPAEGEVLLPESEPAEASDARQRYGREYKSVLATPEDPKRLGLSHDSSCEGLPKRWWRGEREEYPHGCTLENLRDRINEVAKHFQDPYAFLGVTREHEIPTGTTQAEALRTRKTLDIPTRWKTPDGKWHGTTNAQWRNGQLLNKMISAVENGKTDATAKPVQQKAAAAAAGGR